MVADRGGCRSSSHAHTAQLHKHTITMELKQSVSISMTHVGGSSSSGSAAEDDLRSGQQGGSSADPGVDTIALFLPHMYVFPFVSSI